MGADEHRPARTLSAVDVTVREFIENFLIPNQPVLLSAECTGTQDWGAIALWVEPGGCVNMPGLRQLCSELHNPMVPVERAEGYENNGYGARCRESVPFSTFLAEWEGLAVESELARKAGMEGRASTARRPYLKDWHVHRDHADTARALYRTPPHFRDDWLNAWAAPRGDDYRFVYMGPRGTTTPMHHDVLYSYSWSANVCGEKSWVLFPPGVEALLKDGGALIPDISQEACARRSECVRARVRDAWRQAVVVHQQPGEVLFVPAGWHHQVRNETDCISINHNWTNGVGAEHVWRFLQTQVAAVHAALIDVHPDRNGELAFDTEDEWLAHCEVVLRADTGLSLEQALGMFLQGVRNTQETSAAQPVSRDPRLHGVRVALAEVIPAVLQPHYTRHSTAVEQLHLCALGRTPCANAANGNKL